MSRSSKAAEADSSHRALAFFGARPIFRFDDFEADYVAAGRSKAAARAVIDHHVRTGRLVNIRRGIFRYVDRPFDPYALGSQLRDDAVIAYGSAVQFHKLLEAKPSKTITVMSKARIEPLDEQGYHFRAVAFPAPKHGIAEYRGEHQPVRVTTPARTVADIVDRPDLGPGLEEVFQILLNVQLSGWEIAGAAAKLGRALTMMRLGCLFSFHPAYGQPALLSGIEKKWRPKQALYWDADTRKKKNGHLYPRWNLIIPYPLDDALTKYFDHWHGRG